MKEHFKKYYGLNSQEKSDKEVIKLLKKETKTERKGLILGTYGGISCVKGEENGKKKIN